jgi:cellulose synthase/poly-beta-1,6-N-acetylglucosamine synthase-like glycosyltransferase
LGGFALVILGGSILFFLNGDIDSFGVIFMMIFFASYIVPFLLNITRVRIFDFIKGVCCAIFFGPTYIVTITMFGICNIHDVSWGNRPTKANPKFEAIEKDKSLMYRDYRANFLILWVIVNI